MFVLQPEKQEDGTVTGKDRWRQKLLSAMGAGLPVTLRLLPPFSLSSLQQAAVSPSLPVPSSGFSTCPPSGTLIWRISPLSGVP